MPNRETVTVTLSREEAEALLRRGDADGWLQEDAETKLRAALQNPPSEAGELVERLWEKLFSREAVAAVSFGFGPEAMTHEDVARILTELDGLLFGPCATCGGRRLVRVGSGPNDYGESEECPDCIAETDEPERYRVEHVADFISPQTILQLYPLPPRGRGSRARCSALGGRRTTRQAPLSRKAMAGS